MDEPLRHMDLYHDNMMCLTLAFNEGVPIPWWTGIGWCQSMDAGRRCEKSLFKTPTRQKTDLQSFRRIHQSGIVRFCDKTLWSTLANAFKKHHVPWCCHAHASYPEKHSAIGWPIKWTDSAMLISWILSDFYLHVGNVKNNRRFCEKDVKSCFSRINYDSQILLLYKNKYPLTDCTIPNGLTIGIQEPPDSCQVGNYAIS